MRHGRAAVLAAAVLATAITFASGLGAQGIGINTHSACNSGRLEAVAGDPCADGSAIFYNPAALAFEPSVVSVGGTIVRNGHTFRFDANPGTEFKRGPVYPAVPHAWVNYRGGERWAVGAGFWAPYGLTLKWDTTFPGRFTGYDNTVKAIYIQPTAAFQVVPKRLSLAAGLDVVMGTVDIRQRVDLATQALPSPPAPPGLTFNNFGIPFGTDFADVRLKGTGTAYAGHFAAMAKVTDALSIGARYMMGAKVNFKNGTATTKQIATGRVLSAGNPLGLPGGTPLDAVLAPEFTGNGPLANQGVTTELTFPGQVVVGVAWKATPAIELSGDWQWVNWAKWDSAALTFKNGLVEQLYLINQNTNTFRVGGQYAASPNLDLRAGWAYNKAAETDIAVGPLLPEAPRNSYAAGLTYVLTKALSADLFYQYIGQADRRGRVYPLTANQVKAFEQNGSTTGVNVGLYTATGNLFGVTLRYTFGPAR